MGTVSRKRNLIALAIALPLALIFLYSAYLRVVHSVYYDNGLILTASALWVHLTASGAALLLGWLALLRSVLPCSAALHCWLGRLYLLGVAIGLGAGVVLLPLIRQGGVWGQVGLGYGLVLWAYFSFRMWQTARAQEFASHQRWAYRSYGITFSGITLRLVLSSGQALGLSYSDSYAIAACSCFAINTALVEFFWVQRTNRSRTTVEGQR